MRPWYRIVVIILLAVPLWGQAPISQLYLFKIQRPTNTQWVVHSPKYLSGFNRGGYNNQPFFINDQEILLAVQESGSIQTEIYQLHLEQRSFHRLTQTTYSEYSPNLTPDGKYISCVRVDDPVTSLQRLYRYERNSVGRLNSPLPEIKNVGYHTWLDNNTVALFLVNKPNQLALVDITSKDPLIFTSDVGRCMTKNGAGHLIFVHKISDAYWYIKEYDPLLQKSTILCETLSGSEDFVQTPEGQFIMAKGSKLYKTDPRTEKAWTEIADLRYFGLQSISRLALRGENLILVNQPSK
ncbi:MAG: hypothetical protein SH818_02175 [Saprospiraceae bacterium]|nr:hypothetical protein [Saprospiraceae bacterium]